VVIVHEAEAFITAYRQALETYFDAPVATASLVLLVSSWPGNTKLAKKLPKAGELIECATPEGAELLGWIRNRARQSGKEIAREAAGLLAECVGADLANLHTELEKLCAYVGSAKSITPADISAVVSASALPEAFAVTNAITAGDARSALKALGGALSSRGAEFALLGQIAWHLRRALRVAQAVWAGQSPQTAMRAARVFYGQREFEAMIRKRPLAKLQNDFRRLIAADLGLKSGLGVLPTLQQLVMDLCR
jgi:DNA polymerase-3 subunit delta